MPTFLVIKRPPSGRPAKPVFRYYITLSAFCQGKNDIKLHKNFPETLCNLPIAIRSKSDIIIIVQGEQKRTDNKWDWKQVLKKPLDKKYQLWYNIKCGKEREPSIDHIKK